MPHLNFSCCYYFLLEQVSSQVCLLVFLPSILFMRLFSSRVLVMVHLHLLMCCCLGFYLTFSLWLCCVLIMCFFRGLKLLSFFYWLSSLLFSKVVSFLLVLPFEIQAW